MVVNYFRRKNRKNMRKEVYLFEERCIYSRNKVYRFVELIHFLTKDLVIYTKKLNFANRMKEMQFSVVVMTILMCSALTLLMPGRVKRNTVINRSRWLMVGALGLIGMQFLIQYVTQLRAMGVTQAVLVNLTVLLPASALMDLSILNLQRQGRLNKLEKWGWIAAWLVVTGGLAVAVWIDGHPLEQLSERVRMTEIMMSIVYASMQMYYSVLQFRELIRMETIIENYFDREHKELTRWMKHAIAVNGLIAIIVPIFIFGTNILLVIFSLSFFWGIFMMWFSFVRYFTSNAIKRVQEAEENAREEQQEVRSQQAEGEGLSAETMQHIDHVVERWLASGGYLQAGITNPVAAGEMNIPRYQLTAWVKASGHSSFTRWITALRIEEAKRVLQEHRDWTNEAVADHCGFSRTHFQKIFKQATGVSPSDYQEKQSRE